MFGQDISKSLLSNPATSKIFMAGLNIWKSAGYSSIIVFAAITSIDTELYDAAAVDGCGRWQKIKFITVPSLMPTLLVVTIIQVGFMLSSGLDQYYVFMNPLVQSKIEVLDYYVYRIGMLENDIPVSTAVSMSKTFISVFMVFSINRLAKKFTGQSII
jgi:putative aldouronate transport system permease protein